MEPAPIGFELQAADGIQTQEKPAQINVTHINVSYPGYPPQPPQAPQPEVSPAPPEGNLYPQMDEPEAKPPAPIGFEQQVDAANGKGQVNDVAVNMEDAKVINEQATLKFRDGQRNIDYVLAYEPGTGESEEKKRERRKKFEDNLKHEGLELEYEGKETSKNGKTCFVKVHAPWETLTKYAELTNMKMPLAINDMETDLEGFFGYMCSKIPTPFDQDPDILPEEVDYFTAPFNRARQDQFIIQDKLTFFTNAQRSKLTYEILSRAVYEESEFSDDKSTKKFGIKKLVNNQTYTAAFPLHDGRYTSDHSLLTSKTNDRHLLYEIWAKPGAWYKYQPLDQVRNYFGEKIGIYFSWLGYYTSMLIPAALVGLVAFIYGLATFLDDVPSSEICDIKEAGNFTMCPLCDKRCTYWRLEDSCRYSKATYLFDNYATVAFAIFMALWASFFHEFWKRKQAELEYDWDVADFEEGEETVRPEYEVSVSRRRTNPVTKRDEPYIPPWSKCCRYGTTFTILLFFLCLVLGAVFGVILYRIAIASVFYANETNLIKAQASFIATTTAACINLVIIIIMNFIYQKIAYGLTELEQHRTQTEWEDAFTFKMFLFQFVNYYSSIIYIAFFKGRFVGRPGDYNYSLLDKRQEECDPAGCLIELCIQLGVVMVGKQSFNNFKEVILPKLKVWFKSRQSKSDDAENKVYSRWEQDYNLADIPFLGLFDEYLEMVIQYGFVTIFVAAFPLAPLFALLNNVIEIRLDAYKFTTQWKRPLAERAQDIGIWFGILRGISAIAVVSNAVIIAFTSEFIPKLVYRYGYSNTTSLDGYVDFSLSTFRVSDFQSESIPDNKNFAEFGNVTECRFRGYYDSPSAAKPYAYTMAFWHILAAQLAFIVVFENLVVFATWLVMYLIPDMPYKVKMLMLRENFLSKEALYSAETIQKARKKGQAQDSEHSQLY